MSDDYYKAIAVVGKKHEGKSTYVKNRIPTMFNLQHQKVLVLVEHDDNVYGSYPRLNSYDAIELWLKSPRHPVAKFYDDDNPFEMLRKLRFLALPSKNLLRNGGIIFEDCTNYIDPNPHREIKTLLTNHRHYKLDLIFTTHSLEFIPKFFWKMINYVTLFKTQDEFESERELKERKIPNRKAIYRTWHHVKHSPKQHYSVTISTGV